MKSKLIYFILGGLLVTLIYFADDIKATADNIFKGDILAYTLVVMTLINFSLIAYTLKLTLDNRDDR